jgi:hypothetical protein
MLLIIQAIALLALPHNVGIQSLWIMVGAACLTLTMALSAVANAWWGTLQALTIAAALAGATGGEPWQEIVLKLTHIGAGLGLIIAWSLLVIGFSKHASSTAAEEA